MLLLCVSVICRLALPVERLTHPQQYPGCTDTADIGHSRRLLTFSYMQSAASHWSCVTHVLGLTARLSEETCSTHDMFKALMCMKHVCNCNL